VQVDVEEASEDEVFLNYFVIEDLNRDTDRRYTVLQRCNNVSRMPGPSMKQMTLPRHLYGVPDM
jgi:hypothetical protein